MNKVWIRICPILGLLLLLSVCPLSTNLCELNSQVKLQEKVKVNSENGFLKNPAKCIYGSNSFPGGGRGVLKEDLNRLCEGTGRNCQAQDGSNFFSEGDNGILNTDLYRWCKAKCGKNCRTYSIWQSCTLERTGLLWELSYQRRLT